MNLTRKDNNFTATSNLTAIEKYNAKQRKKGLREYFGYDPENPSKIIREVTLAETPIDEQPGRMDTIEPRPLIRPRKQSLVRQPELSLVDKTEQACDESEQVLRTRTLHELQHQTIATADYLVENIFPAAGVGVLAGAPKVGKSLFARMLAYDVAEGGDYLFLGHKVNFGSVLYCDLENDEAGLKAITNQMLVDGVCWFQNIHYLVRGELPKVEDGGLDHLRQWCLKYKPKLVVIDNYVCFRTTPSGQSLYDADYKSLDAIRKVALECRCFILVLHHTSKSARGSDPSADLNATFGLGAAANVVLLLKRSPSSQRGTLTISGNSVPYQQIPLNFDPVTLLWGIREVTCGRPPNKQEAAKSFLLEQLDEGPRLYIELTQLVEEQNICGLRTLMSAKKALGVRSTGRKDNTYWALP